VVKSVLVVESHTCFRESLACVLDREPDIQVIGQADSLSEEHVLGVALDAADAVLLGLGMPAGDEVEEMIRKVHDESCPPVAVLVLTTNSDPGWHARLLEAGAERVLTKNASLLEVVGAVLALGFAPLAQPEPL
jgi:two-component system, NarL family, response regulator DevR